MIPICRITAVVLPLLVCLQLACASRAPLAQQEGAAVQEVSKVEFVKMTGRVSADQARKLKPRRANSETIYPGDEITITIYEKLPVSQESRIEMKRVNDEGKIYLLPMGEMNVGGLTVAEVRVMIENGLASLLVSPFCDVVITKKAYEPHVFVFGESPGVGRFPVKDGDRLIDIIAAVGGASETAYRRSIKVIRANDTTVSMYSIDLYQLIAKGDFGQNIVMQDQDVVFVPRRLYTNIKEVSGIVGTLLPWYYFVRQTIGL